MDGNRLCPPGSGGGWGRQSSWDVGDGRRVQLAKTLSDDQRWRSVKHKALRSNSAAADPYQAAVRAMSAKLYHRRRTEMNLLQNARHFPAEPPLIHRRWKSMEWMEGWREGGTPESPRRRLPPTPGEARQADYRAHPHHRQLPLAPGEARLPPSPGLSPMASPVAALPPVPFSTSPTPHHSALPQPPALDHQDYALHSASHTPPLSTSPTPAHWDLPQEPNRLGEGQRNRSSSGRRLPSTPGAMGSLDGPSPPPPAALPQAPLHQQQPFPLPPTPGAAAEAEAAVAVGREPSLRLAAMRNRKSEGAVSPFLLRQDRVGRDSWETAGPSRGRSMDVGRPELARQPPKLAFPPDAKGSNGFGSVAAHSPSISPEEEEEWGPGSGREEAADPAAFGLSPELYGVQSGSGAEGREGRLGSGAGTESPALSGSESWDGAGPRPAQEVKGPQYGIGNLQFSLQYFPVRKRLRVNVLKAEGVSTGLKDAELHGLVKLCVMPGKGQKQQSRVVKSDHSLVFNEEFFFDNLAQDDITRKALWVRLCHQSGKLSHKDLVIGDVEVPFVDLEELVSKREIPCLFGLRPRSNQKNGTLHISSNLEMDSKRLTINVLRVEGLPKGINGAPDPLIKITVRQAGKSQTKQSRAIKNSCSATYKEAVMFVVDTKPVQLIDDLDIVLGVFDAAKAGQKDDLIGQCFLGRQSSEKSELDQWKSTRDHPGREYKATHPLRLPPKPIVVPK